VAGIMGGSGILSPLQQEIRCHTEQENSIARSIDIEEQYIFEDSNYYLEGRQLSKSNHYRNSSRDTARASETIVCDNININADGIGDPHDSNQHNNRVMIQNRDSSESGEYSSATSHTSDITSSQQRLQGDQSVNYNSSQGQGRSSRKVILAR